MKTSLVVAMLLAMQAAQQPYVAPRLAAGSPPGIAEQAIGGGQAIVELSIGASGSVDKITTLRSTPPFTNPK